MRVASREHIRAAYLALSEAIIDNASARNGTARETGYDVDGIAGRASDENKLMDRLRAIRQELEDLEFVEYL